MTQNKKNHQTSHLATLSPLAIDEYWMTKALALAQKAALKNEVPVGALIINTKTNILISQAYNLKETLRTPLAHAEVLAIHKAATKLQNWRLIGHTLYVTLEPCVMCCGTIFQSRLDRVVFGALDPKGGATSLALPSHNHQTHFQACVLEKNCQNILFAFFKNLRAQKKEIS